MKPGRDRGSAASIHARLLSGAHERGEELQRVLVRYAGERFLYRLSRSKHAGQFVLKGATLFSAWVHTHHRSTKDIDLLGFGPSTADRLQRILGDIFALEVEPDALVYDGTTLRVGPIRIDQEYEGLRATFVARLGSARIALQVDVGFGDALAPPPEEVELPTLLDQPRPRLRAYRREHVIAEKFHAMVTLGLLNTRMKDYFDVWVLSRTFELDAATLVEAIDATFDRRRAPVPTDVPDALTDRFALDPSKHAQWTAFLRRTGVRDAPELPAVVEALRQFLAPSIIRAAVLWPAGGPWTRTRPP